MPLNKATLKSDIYSKFKDIMTNQAKKATEGDESQDPAEIIDDIANKMATAVADAVDTYVKGGDITVGPDNIVVTSSSPGTPAAVAPAKPAKML